MQPQVTIPLKIGDSAILDIPDYQVRYEYFGNNPTIEVKALETDEIGTPAWRFRTDYTRYDYKTGATLDRVRLIFEGTTLLTDINVTIK